MITVAENRRITAERRPLGTAEDVAEILNTPLSSVYEMGRKNELPGCVRLGRRMRFDLDKLETWLQSGGNK